MEQSAWDAGLLYRIGKIANSRRTLDEALNEIIALLAQRTGCQACFVYVPDRSSGEMILRASHAPPSWEPGSRGEGALSVPLTGSNNSQGVLDIYFHGHREATPAEVTFAAFVAQQIGGAVERAGLEAENARLLEEVRRTRSQLEVRKVVERAKGILQRRLHLTEEEAYLRLRNESRRLRTPMKQLADAIILQESQNAGAKSFLNWFNS